MFNNPLHGVTQSDIIAFHFMTGMEPMKHFARHIALVTAALLALSACDQLFSKPAKPAKKVTKERSVDASSYVESLSSARIILAGGGSLSDISARSRMIENYTKQKKVKPARLNLALLEYRTGSSTQRALSPINDASLSEIFPLLASNPYELKEVRVVGVQVTPGIPIKIAQDRNAAQEQIEARHASIASNSHKIPALQEAELQIRLLRYFMGARARDAAYITADNAKRLVSSLEKKHGAKASELSKELEGLEGELRTAMPY
jgi:hypothetical protein